MNNYEILKEYEEHKEPIPSYEEWRRLQSSWVDEMSKAVHFEKALEDTEDELNKRVLVEAENAKLKELLRECRERQVKIREALSLNMSKIAFDITFKIENEIDNALGEKK